MRLSILFFLCCVAFRVTSHKIRAECSEVHDFPPTKLKDSPSMVAGLNVTLVRAGEENKLNISWAINIDASINYLEGTWIDISGKFAYICNYDPPFTSANLTGLEQEWFYFLKNVRIGFHSIKIYNIPLPPLGAGPQSKSASIQVPRQKEANSTNRTTIVTTGDPQQTSQMAAPVAE
ncbi:hypothetical protein CHARACLAT_031438, partial [Characodon lateralis]|nr:hypothetical protein [Characodon lateralis]